MAKLKISDAWVVTGHHVTDETFVVGVFSSERRAKTAARERFELFGRSGGYAYQVEGFFLNEKDY